MYINLSAIILSFQPLKGGHFFFADSHVSGNNIKYFYAHTGGIYYRLFLNRNTGVGEKFRILQGSKGIRQLPTNSFTSPMFIHKITPL